VTGGATLSRVCMVVHSEYPHDPRVAREAHAARDAGCTVEVIALREAGQARREVVDGIVVTRLNVTHRLWRQKTSLLGVLAEYLSFAARATAAVGRRALGPRRFTILQVHNPPDFLIFAGLAAKLAGARVIFDVHDRSPLIYGARFGATRLGRVVVRALEVLEGIACRFADQVITVHEPYARALTKHGLPRERVTVVMNTPPPHLVDQVRGQPRHLRAEDGADRADVRDSFLIAYHGTITPWYGLPLLVAALARVDALLGAWRAVLLGDGDAVDETRALATALGIADKVEISGHYLPIDAALARVATAGVGVVPNLPSPLNQLTLSTKLLEYVALGVPAVVARLETIAQHFSEDEVTFFEPGSAEGLGAALAWVRTHPLEAALKAERASQRFEAYAWPANRVRYLAVLGGEGTGQSIARPQRSQSEPRLSVLEQAGDLPAYLR
jgi:glycosyltransferase involved in cell wall biosynthesis